MACLLAGVSSVDAASALSTTVYAASAPAAPGGRPVARVLLPAAPPSVLIEAVKAKLKPGELRIAPNVLDQTRRGGRLRFYVRGTAGGTATLTVYDEAGEHAGTVGIALDAYGFGVVEADAAFIPGRELGAGRYRVAASGGGVADIASFVIARKVTK